MNSNPKRGAGYRRLAIEFLRNWPIGTTLTWTQFCTWMHAVGLMSKPEPVTEDKQSDEWLAHLQRRHQGRMNLNKGGAHSEMQNHGGAFVVLASKGSSDILRVTSTKAALATQNASSHIASLAKLRLKQLNILRESQDWSSLPEHVTLFAEELEIDISNFVERVDNDARKLQQKFTRLQHRLRLKVEAGELKTLNGGIKNLLEDKIEENESDL